MIMKSWFLRLATLSSLVALVSRCTAPAADRAACQSSASPCVGPSGIVYVEGNDPRPGRNAILAFARAGDGSLTPLPGSPFLTDGAGVGNPKQAFGPSDSDLEIATSPDRGLLFAVNSGSNTVAVFRIAPDGALSAIPGSPFDSGGETPVSVGVAGKYLVVVNKAQGTCLPPQIGREPAGSQGDRRRRREEDVGRGPAVLAALNAELAEGGRAACRASS